MRGNFKIYDKYSHFTPGVAECIILVVLLGVGALIGSAVTIVFQHFFGNEAAMSYGTLISYPVMFLPPMIYASAKSRKASWSSEPHILDSNNFSPVGGVACALAAMVMTVAGSIVIDSVNSIMPPMPDWLETALKSMTTGPFWANFIAVSIFAPFFEEWLCRGMILRGLLVKGMKPAGAIVLSAFLFALIHANPWQAIPAFAIGLLLGYVYYRTGSLKLTMLMHFTNNTIALIVSHIDAIKDYDNWVEIMGIRNYIICSAACVILIILAVRTFRKVIR